MKKLTIVLSLLLFVSILGYSVPPPNTYLVRATITGNNTPTSGLEVTCIIDIYDSGTFIKRVIVTLDYDGDGEYIFNSGYYYDHNDSFTWRISSTDTGQNPTLYLKGRGFHEGSSSAYVNLSWTTSSGGGETK